MLACSIIAACKPRDDMTATERQQAAELNASFARERGLAIAQEIEYFRDPRTNLCFAYLWRNTSISLVDCARVEKFLLNPEPPPAPAEAPQTKTAP